MTKDRPNSNQISYSRQPHSKANNYGKQWVPQRPAWQGFIITRQPLKGPPSCASYWYKIEQGKNLRYELAGVDYPYNWFEWLQTNFGPHPDWLSHVDAEMSHYYFARLLADRLHSCVFISMDGNLPSRSRITAFFQDDRLSQEDCQRLLAGTLKRRRTEHAALVCYCFCITHDVVVNAIRQHGLHTVEQLRDRLMVGSRCQSCLTALKAVLEETLGDE